MGIMREWGRYIRPEHIANGFKETFRSFAEIVRLGEQTAKIVKPAEEIFDIHSKIYGIRAENENHGNRLAAAFDEYIKRVEENPEDVEKFRLLVEAYKNARNENERETIIKLAEHLTHSPEHVERISRIIRKTYDLHRRGIMSDDHREIVFRTLHRIAIRSTSSESVEHLTGMENLLELYERNLANRDKIMRSVNRNHEVLKMFAKTAKGTFKYKNWINARYEGKI